MQNNFINTFCEIRFMVHGVHERKGRRERERRDQEKGARWGRERRELEGCGEYAW